MRKRSKSREFAVQMMYQSEMTGDSADDVISRFWLSFEPQSEDITSFAAELFVGAHVAKEANDALIKQFLKAEWPFERIGEMEKSILRVALDELLTKETPTYTVLDEYVTLTRRFTDDKTASFVNGLLDNVRSKFKPNT